MSSGLHFILPVNLSAERYARWLLNEIEKTDPDLLCHLACRDALESLDTLVQSDEALRSCSSVVVMLSATDDSFAAMAVDDWRRASTYNKPITVVRPKTTAAVPKDLTTRLLIELGDSPGPAVLQLVERLRDFSTPAGQLQSLREQLAALRHSAAENAAFPSSRQAAGIAVLEQQIDALDNAASRERATHERIASALELERRPARHTAAPARTRLRVINAAPLPVPRYFEDRHDEAKLIAAFLNDAAAFVLTIHGRGGVGKTALICKVLAELERRVEASDPEAARYAAIVYLNATHTVDNLFAQLVWALHESLQHDKQESIRLVLESSASTAATKIRELIRAMAGDPVIVLFDNFEDAISPEDGLIRDPDLRVAIDALSQMARHPLKLVFTSRVIPEQIARLPPSRQMRVSLASGLPSPYAERVLQGLDVDGSTGLRDAPPSLLASVARHTRGFPRALEAFHSILLCDASIDVETLVNDLHRAAHSAELVTRALVGEAYSRLLPLDQRILQGVAAFGTPVPVAAVEFILDDWAPRVDTASTLRRLTAAHFIRREANQFYMHPVDREYCLGRLSDDERRLLRGRAADYFEEVGRPRSEWRTVEDVEPHVREFHLRLEAQDPDSAAAILERIGPRLERLGAFGQLLTLTRALETCATDNLMKLTSLRFMARAHWRMGNFNEAIKAQQHVVELSSGDQSPASSFHERLNLLIYRREIGISGDLLDSFQSFLREFEVERPFDSDNMRICLNHVADCLEDLGHLDSALDHQRRANDMLDEDSETDDIEASLHNLGARYFAIGDIRLAEQFFRDALTKASASNNPLWRANHLSMLASCAHCEGRLPDAYRMIGEAMSTRRDIGDWSGLADDQRRKSEWLLGSGETLGALRLAAEAHEAARGLGLPLDDYRRTRAEACIANGDLDSAHGLISSPEMSTSAVRWRSESVFGTVLLRMGLVRPAIARFTTALENAETWLARSTTNPSAWSGKGLALTGLALCGDDQALANAESAYLRAVGDGLQIGRCQLWRRELERLAGPAGSARLGKLPTILGGMGNTSSNDRPTPERRVFISYAREDRPWLDRLSKLLAPAIRNGQLEVWDDTRIAPGRRWRDEIDQALARASVGVLLISSDFLASDFIVNEELPYLLKAAEKRGLTLIAIYLSPCLVELSGLLDRQWAHSIDRPLDSLAPPELSATLAEIARRISSLHEAT